MNWTTAVRPMFQNVRINGLRKNARNATRRNARSPKVARRTVKRLVIVAMIALLHLSTNDLFVGLIPNTNTKY